MCGFQEYIICVLSEGFLYVYKQNRSTVFTNDYSIFERDIIVEHCKLFAN